MFLSETCRDLTMVDVILFVSIACARQKKKSLEINERNGIYVGAEMQIKFNVLTNFANCGCSEELENQVGIKINQIDSGHPFVISLI